MSNIEHTLKVGDEVWVKGSYSDHYEAKPTKVAKVYKTGHVILEGHEERWRVDHGSFYKDGNYIRDGWDLTAPGSSKWRSKSATSSKAKWEQDQQHKAENEERKILQAHICKQLSELENAHRYSQPVAALRQLAADLTAAIEKYEQIRKA